MKTILGVFKDRKDAEKVVEDLEDLSVRAEDISFVVQDTTEITNETERSATVAVADGTGAGAITGGMIGAVAGLVVANGVLPGLGTLFVAGPIATALGFTGAAATTTAGTITGAAAGGLVGALSGLGVAAEDAELYEAQIKDGGAVVGASIDAVDEEKVEEIFTSHHADQVRVYSV
ncbi:MAG: low temperature-induced protein [Candidatus Doudnabacteria bacterium]|nr:low temperature-induced protein [Candidatus Doudnabacteria bacterium]